MIRLEVSEKGGFGRLDKEIESLISSRNLYPQINARVFTYDPDQLLDHQAPTHWTLCCLIQRFLIDKSVLANI